MSDPRSELIEVRRNEQIILQATFVLVTTFGLVLASALSLIKIRREITAMIYGVICGRVFWHLNFDAIITYYRIDPHNVVLLFVPTVVLVLVYHIDTYLFKKSMAQIALVCCVGPLFFIGTFGGLVVALIGVQCNFWNVAMIGVILLANDVAEDMELDGIRNLEVMMNSETVFTTSLQIIIYTLTIGAFNENFTEWYQVVMQLARYIFIPIPIGYIFAIFFNLLFRCNIDDYLNISTIVLPSVFLVYFLCSDILYCSGTIAIFIILFYITQERPRLSHTLDRNISQFIKAIYYVIQIFSLVIFSTHIAYRMGAVAHLPDYFIAIGIYILANALRMLSFLIISPLLSRTGYGFDFASMVTMVWAAKKGPLQLICLYGFDYYNVAHLVGYEMYTYTIIYMLLTYIINISTLNMLLVKLGIIKHSIRRKMNISHCIGLINERASKLNSMQKMNRELSDANWLIIATITKIAEPFHDDATIYIPWELRTPTYCPTCQSLIKIEPTEKEMKEMYNEINLKILKGIRVSFVRQYENGILFRNELRALIQAVDVALDSSTLELNLKDLFNLMRDANEYNNVDSVYDIRLEYYMLDSKRRVRKLCRTISNSPLFQGFMYCIVLVNVIFLLVLISLYETITHSYIPLGFEIAFMIVFILESVIVYLGCSITGYVEAIKLYFGDNWRKLDFALIIIYVIDLLVFVCLYACTVKQQTLNKMLIYLKLTRCLRLIKLCRLAVRIYPKIRKMVERKKDTKIAFAFTLGQAVIVGFEDVLDRLDKMSTNSSIREGIKMKVVHNKNLVSKEIGELIRAKPWITTRIKTKQAMNVTIKSMHDGIQELQSAGLVDKFEHHKLKSTLEERRNVIEAYKHVPTASPRNIFFEIPWLCFFEDNVADYLYGHVKTKIWKAGEVVCNDGEHPEGIYILVAGLFKITYYPDANTLKQLENNGALPITDFIGTVFFSEEQEEYAFVGNSIGELAVLTGRPYNCQIIADAPSQAYIITSDVLFKGISMSTDPIYGLESRLWKHVCCNMAKRILSDIPAYSSSTYDQMNTLLSRATIPNVSSFRVFKLPDSIEDVILLEGIVVDFATREVFVAPCYVPRTVTKMMFPGSSTISFYSTIPTKLMLIPFRDVDEYDMMEKAEAQSELIGETPRFLNFPNMKRLKRRRKNIMTNKRDVTSSKHSYKNLLHARYSHAGSKSKPSLFVTTSTRNSR